MEPRYNLIFTGQLQPACSPQQAIAAVASAFHLSTEAVSKLILGGKPRVIRRDLDRQTADRLVDALNKAGLEVQLVPLQLAAETGSRVSTPAAMSKPAPQQASAQRPVAAEVQTAAQSSSEAAGERCPRCGSSRVEADSCQMCGVSIDQFRIRQAVSSRLGTVAGPGPNTAAQTDASRSVNPRTASGPSPFARRNRALERTIGNPRGRAGARLPIYLLGSGLLGLGLVALVVALQPEPATPPAKRAEGAVSADASGRASSDAAGAAGTTGPAMATGARSTTATQATAVAGSVPPAPHSLTATGLAADAGANAEQQPLELSKALKDLEAKAATARPQPPTSEPLDELPPDIRALYEAQQARQSFGERLNR